MTNDRPHALYRFYADDHTLLYVGITLDPGQRWRAHRDDKPWWHEVTSIQLELYPDRDAVMGAETAAIIAEQPRYNIVHNTSRPAVDVTDELDDLLLALTGADPATGPWGSRAEHMPDMCTTTPGCEGVYLPYRWTRGEARYQCAAGHTWMCWWGHGHSGEVPGNHARRVDQAAP